jgi:Na+-transporting NADH:ubiquinone oxidoreductase subunit NqrF
MTKDKETVMLTMNGQTITAKSGTKLLWAALDNGIYIPNLCAMPALLGGNRGKAKPYHSLHRACRRRDGR